ncbi:uncharacterized protein LOC117651679 [Thrips palmi]|uniref:Uncharacterized protein LOC117651679 n=1 Tax=Thrips palmi TaxID=161013 RepID=A0A6P9A1Z8_THRPL|nr:uncharacterized protein LOC117651679 [Thrips palmi]
MLTDGATLLDVLPLDAAPVWRDRRDHRVLLHAPAAKSLTIGTTCPILLQSSLRRSRVQVKSFSLRVLHAHGQESKVDTGVVHFLSRQRSLRGLLLFLSWGYNTAILATIASLSSLRKLHMLLDEGKRYRQHTRYNGELAGGLPELRELRVYALDHWTLNRRSFPGLVGDLARGARALRVLEVDLPSAADRDAVLQLRGLEHVHLHVFKDAERPQSTADVVREAFAFLFQMDTTALQSVAIWLGPGAANVNWLAELTQSRKVAQEFLASMPHVLFDVFYGRTTKTNDWYREIINRLEKNRPADAVCLFRYPKLN